MAKLGLGQWLQSRFVQLTEIVGYSMSAVVGIGVVYSLYVQVEVIARVNGELRPLSAEVKADGDAIPIEYLVASGDEVVEGQPVMKVAIDEESRRRLKARRWVEAAVAVLASGSSSGDSSALESARATLALMPQVDEAVILAAPATGMFWQEVDATQAPVVPRGEALACLYDMRDLVFEAPLGSQPTVTRVAEGQDTRGTVSISGQQQKLVGRVLDVVGVETKKNVSIRFVDVPQVVRDAVFRPLYGENNEKLEPVSVEIVVGHQSLFKQVFGRNQ